MADFQDGKHMKSAKLRATVTQTRGSQGAQGYTSLIGPHEVVQG